MACAGAYECATCGGVVIVGTPKIVEHYGGPHVCNPKVAAEWLFLADPYAPWPKELDE